MLIFLVQQLENSPSRARPSRLWPEPSVLQSGLLPYQWLRPRLPAGDIHLCRLGGPLFLPTSRGADTTLAHHPCPCPPSRPRLPSYQRASGTLTRLLSAGLRGCCLVPTGGLFPPTAPQSPRSVPSAAHSQGPACAGEQTLLASPFRLVVPLQGRWLMVSLAQGRWPPPQP